MASSKNAATDGGKTAMRKMTTVLSLALLIGAAMFATVPARADDYP